MASAAGVSHCGRFKREVLEFFVDLVRARHEVLKVDVDVNLDDLGDSLDRPPRSSRLERIGASIDGAAWNIPLLNKSGDGVRIFGDEFWETSGAFYVGQRTDVDAHEFLPGKHAAAGAPTGG